MIAYPQDPQDLMHKVGLLPEELCADLSVQFAGSDRDCVRSDRALMISVARLRAAFTWLTQHSWEWVHMTTTSAGSDPKLSDEVEALLEAYRSANQGLDEAVPEQLVQGAVQIQPASAKVHAAGPADAAQHQAGDPEDVHSLFGGVGAAPPVNNTSNEEAPPAGEDNGDHGENAAVIGPGVEDMSPLLLWEKAIESLQLIEHCEGKLRECEHKGDTDTAQEWEGQHTLAAVEALRTTQRLRREAVRRMLKQFQSQDGGVSVPMPHGPEPLDSFSETFWLTCFVDLFPVGDCRERDPRRKKHGAALQDRQWAKCLLTRADHSRWRMHSEFIDC